MNRSIQLAAVHTAGARTRVISLCQDTHEVMWRHSRLQ